MMITPQISNPAGIFPKFYVIWRELAGYVPVTGHQRMPNRKGCHKVLYFSLKSCMGVQYLRIKLKHFAKSKNRALIAAIAPRRMMILLLCG
jgi:hypothetical protein